MRLIGYIFAASILLAILRAALAAIVVAYLLTLIVCAAIRPRETIGFLTYLLICFLLANHTVATLETILSCVIVGAVVRASERRALRLASASKPIVATGAVKGGRRGRFSGPRPCIDNRRTAVPANLRSCGCPSEAVGAKRNRSACFAGLAEQPGSGIVATEAPLSTFKHSTLFNISNRNRLFVPKINIT